MFNRETELHYILSLGNSGFLEAIEACEEEIAETEKLLKNLYKKHIRMYHRNEDSRVIDMLENEIADAKEHKAFLLAKRKRLDSVSDTSYTNNGYHFITDYIEK